jgi:hypothetical protein
MVVVLFFDNVIVEISNKVNTATLFVLVTVPRMKRGLVKRIKYRIERKRKEIGIP